MSDEQPTETTPEETPRVHRPKWRQLDDIMRVRLALAAVIKQVYDGKLPCDRGSVCVTGLRALASIIYDTDIEKRLKAVEDRQRDSNQ